MSEPIKQTFAVACKQFFGLRPGTTTSDFMAEMKALTPQDKLDLRAEFLKVGIEIIEAAPKTV